MHTSAIAVPLSELITMHQAKLRKRALDLQQPEKEAQAQQKKRAKAEKDAAKLAAQAAKEQAAKVGLGLGSWFRLGLG